MLPVDEAAALLRMLLLIDDAAPMVDDDDEDPRDDAPSSTLISPTDCRYARTRRFHMCQFLPSNLGTDDDDDDRAMICPSAPVPRPSDDDALK